jgi:HAD superfamily hydrolase (TIGR01509 family)
MMPDLRAISTFLFDLDGTLTVPVIDFNALRLRLGVPDGTSIAHALNALPPARRDAGFAIVREAELTAARNAAPNRGALELLSALRERGLGTALITRNSHEAVAITLRTLGVDFDVVITREFGPMKPSPEPVLEALCRLNSRAQDALMIGDFRDDIDAGRAASTATCLIMNGSGPPLWEADLHLPYPSDLHAVLTQAWK